MPKVLSDNKKIYLSICIFSMSMKNSDNPIRIGGDIRHIKEAWLLGGYLFFGHTAGSVSDQRTRMLRGCL